MAPLRRIVVISDFCDGQPPAEPVIPMEGWAQTWLAGGRGPSPFEPCDPFKPDEVAVVGGYLERLPLTAVNSGLCDRAEIWNFWGREGEAPFRRETPWLARRSFHTEASPAPRSSADMLGHIKAFGAPEILCVWGLGVDEAILEACADSVKIYNSIDAPALRIPPEVSRHFDLVLTGAEWQSQVVRDRHPDMTTAIMPIGPEFASPETFFPLGLEKIYDVIYVAAAQGYKRHDILFEALAKLPRSVRALCVCGYGELGDALRQQAAELGINVDFVGPPGVGFAEVNRLMNLARIGLVCGVDDGAPAILTEYMLAGLPVLANSQLSCGLQYITPETGRSARAESFHEAITEMLGKLGEFAPRETVTGNWSWPHSAGKFADLIAQTRRKKNRDAKGTGGGASS